MEIVYENEELETFQSLTSVGCWWWERPWMGCPDCPPGHTSRHTWPGRRASSWVPPPPSGSSGTGRTSSWPPSLSHWGKASKKEIFELLNHWFPPYLYQKLFFFLFFVFWHSPDHLSHGGQLSVVDDVVCGVTWEVLVPGEHRQRPLELLSEPGPRHHLPHLGRGAGGGVEGETLRVQGVEVITEGETVSVHTSPSLHEIVYWKSIIVHPPCCTETPRMLAASPGVSARPLSCTARTSRSPQTAGLQSIDRWTLEVVRPSLDDLSPSDYLLSWPRSRSEGGGGGWRGEETCCIGSHLSMHHSHTLCPIWGRLEAARGQLGKHTAKSPTG